MCGQCMTVRTARLRYCLSCGNRTGPARPGEPEPPRFPSLQNWQLVSRIKEDDLWVSYSVAHAHLGIEAIGRMLTDGPFGVLSENQDRFLRGAQLAASLRHLHIATCFDAGEDGEGHSYRIDEHWGDDLDVWVEKCRPSPEMIAAIGAQVASALVAIHRADVLHGDVVPARIEIRDGTAKLGVFDFGLIMREMALIPHKRGGTIVGVIGLMAREAVFSQAESASDVYQLGATLYYALTGQYPYSGETIEAGIVHMMGSSVVPLRDHRIDLAEEWYMLLDAMLSRDVEGRPTAEEAQSRLEELSRLRAL